jgi:hypothetical protein
MIRGLSWSRGTVVAAIAGPLHLSMINTGNRHPCRITVALLADIGGQDVLSMLTGCGGSVVTAGAVGSHIGMVEVRR